MRELIKESIVDLKKYDGFVYVTAEGKKIDLHEAASRGIAVTPVNPKAGVIKKLEAAGAIMVAKLSLGALAMGDVWFGGTTRNPWNTKNGSSGSMKKTKNA